MKKALTDVDLHLYLAGSLPPYRRLLLFWALALDPALRGRLRAIRDEAETFRGGEGMAALRAKLYPRSEAGRSAGRPARSARRLGFTLAGGFAALALCAIPFLGRLPVAESDYGEEVIAKGKALGISLYVKGERAYRVEGHKALVMPADTLQVLPLGPSAQHMVLMGWDETQGLVRLFPRDGEAAPQVAPGAPPPALVLDGREESRLICVTSTSPFAWREAEALLRGPIFQPLGKAPPARLEGGLYVQIFSITKGRTRGPADRGRPGKERI